MQNNRIDETNIQLIRGKCSYKKVDSVKIKLALVQSAILLTIEGINRATAGQITEKAFREYGINVTASFTGQVFSRYSIETKTTNGKNRYILDKEQLEGIYEQIAAQCEAQKVILEEAIKHFRELPDRISQLQKQWKNIMQMRSRERELIRLIAEDKQKPYRLPQLEREAKNIRNRQNREGGIQK